MRLSFALVFLLPSLAFAHRTEAIKAVQRKLETLEYIQSLEDPNRRVLPRPARSEAATPPRGPACVRRTEPCGREVPDGEKLGKKFPNKDKHAAFVLKCYDPKTGGFADTPGGKSDVVSTSIGVMAAAELDIPHEKYAKAMDYLKENAKTFEEVRIGAAAVEAWGVKDCPFKLEDWQAIAAKKLGTNLPPVRDGGARMIGSITAFTWRLGLQKETDSKPKQIAQLLDMGQLSDGGWAKQGEKASDIESTYRVMRALMLLTESRMGNAITMRLKKVRHPG